MAIKKGGKSPAKKSEAVKDDASLMGSAKLTVSVKRRLGNGDEVFIAPGLEKACPVADLPAAQVEISDQINEWLTSLLEQYPDVDLDEADDEADDEAEDEAEDDEAEDDDDDGEELSEADVKKMKKAELVELIEDEELDIDTKQKLADLKAAVIEELFGEDDEDEDEDEDDDDDDDGEEPYTEDELEDMSLEELQEVADAWELKAPKIKKGAKLSVKKAAYIKLILEAQDG